MRFVTRNGAPQVYDRAKYCGFASRDAVIRLQTRGPPPRADGWIRRMRNPSLLSPKAVYAYFSPMSVFGVLDKPFGDREPESMIRIVQA